MKHRPENITPAEGFFIATRALNDTARRKMVNLWNLSASNEDQAEYKAIVQREKKAKQRVNVPLHPSNTGGQISNVPPDSSIPGGQSENVPLHPSNTGGQTAIPAQEPPPPLPPEPPTPPAHHTHNAHATPPGTPGAPTVEQVTSFLNSTFTSVPPDRRAECAQSYIDRRESHDPPWHSAGTYGRPPSPVNLQSWQGDCRQFAKNWQQIEDENAATRKAKRQRQSSGAGPPGSSTTRPPQQRTFDDTDL